MSRSLWRVIDCRWVDKEPDVDVIAVVVANGRTGDSYAVTCAGPKGMKSDQFIDAIRAATASLLRAAGGDMSSVGARPLDEVEGSKSLN
jgi:hypothetical protein